jgi:hypothetical protein
MRKVIRAAIIGKGLALLCTMANANPCYDPKHLEAFLKSEYQMSLMSWGMTKDGNMIELWWAEDGHFAAVTTTPQGCVSVAMPQHLHERLRQPPQRNRAAPIKPLDRGESL